MTETEATYAAAGVLGGMALMMMFIGLVVFVLLIIAHWRMFTKAGEPGWKSIIPIYSDYVLFNLVWDVKNFWIYLGLGFGASLLNQVYQSIDPSSFLSIVFAILACIVGIVWCVWFVRLQINTARAYGQGTGFAVGLVLLPNIFNLILGLGSSRYVGAPNQARY